MAPATFFAPGLLRTAIVLGWTLASLGAAPAAAFDLSLRAASRTDPGLPNTTGAQPSSSPLPEHAVSDDGRFVAYSSWSGNVVAGFTARGVDAFVFDRLTGLAVPLSRNHADPSVGGNGFSDSAGISGDGSRAVFASSATDLLPDFSGAGSQLFAVEMPTGTLQLISRSWSDPTVAANDYSQPISISADGRFVYFASSATDLVAGYSGSGLQGYLADLETGSVTLVTSASGSPTAGSTGTFSPWSARASSDGRYLLFAAAGANLVPGNSGASTHLYLYDRIAGQVTLITHVAGAPSQFADGNSFDAAMSRSGSHLAFKSSATNLVAGASVSGSQIYVRAVPAGPTTLASSPVGMPANGGDGDSDLPALDADGRFLAFRTRASNLVSPPIPGGTSQIVMFDRQDGDRTLVTHTPASPSTPSTAGGSWPVVTPDGSRVLFLSNAPDLVEPPLPSLHLQTFDYDVSTGLVRLLTPSVSAARGGSGNSWIRGVSGDSQFAVVESAAYDLVPGDCNRGDDLFQIELESAALEAVSRRGPGLPISRTANGASFYDRFGRQSDDGRFVLFESWAENLAPGSHQPNGGDLWPYFYDRESDTVTRLGGGLVATASASADAKRVGSSSSFGGLDGTSARTVSADGATVVFSGTPAVGVPFQAYAYLRRDGEERLVSHRHDDVSAPGDGTSISVSVSAGARYVVLSSDAPDLVAGYQGDGSQLFVHDLVTHQTRLVTHAAGSPVSGSAGLSELIGVSFDGRWIAFRSTAGDLVAGGVAGNWQAYLFDGATGLVRLVSHVAGSPGQPCSGAHLGPGDSMSQDGRFVAFTSTCAGLVGLPGSFETQQAVLWDRSTSSTQLVSHSVAGSSVGSNQPASAPRLSRDGRFVVFVSEATDLVAGYQGDTVQAFLFERATGAIRLISRSTAGPNRGAEVGVWEVPTISADGSRIALLSASRDLVAGAPTTGAHVYLYEVGSDAFTVLTAPPDSRPVSLPESHVLPEISADGRSVVFAYPTDYLTERDWNQNHGAWDVFIATEAPPGLVFLDGFSSGDTSRWSLAAP
jgi:Tol biopolymer transport system component